MRAQPAGAAVSAARRAQHAEERTAPAAPSPVPQPSVPPNGGGARRGLPPTIKTPPERTPDVALPVPALHGGASGEEVEDITERIYCAYPSCAKHYASQDGVRKHAKRFARERARELRRVRDVGRSATRTRLSPGHTARGQHYALPVIVGAWPLAPRLERRC